MNFSDCSWLMTWLHSDTILQGRSERRLSLSEGRPQSQYGLTKAAVLDSPLTS